MNEGILKKRIRDLAKSYDGAPTGGFITGAGPIPCPILFIGEAPGKSEIEAQKPFVGMTGALFEKRLQDIGLSKQDIRITSACFLRPITLKTNKNGKETISNRQPKTAEIELFRAVLDQEIALVQPKIIITLGNIPLKRIAGLSKIGEHHGRPFYSEKYHCHIFPLYHPSSVIHNRTADFQKTYDGDWEQLALFLDSIL